MIKTPSTLLIMLSVCFSVIIGCEATDTPSRNQFNPIPSTTDWRESEFANSENPYDYLGALHNAGLEYINERVGFNLYIDTLYPRVDTLAVLFTDSVMGLSNHPDTFLHHLKIGRFIATHYDSIMNDLGLSVDAVLQIEAIDLILNDTTRSVSTQISDILNVEANAINLLSGTDEQVVLITAAIARYSTAYWRSADSLTWPQFIDHQRPIEYYPSVSKNRSAKPQLWQVDVGIFFAKNRWARLDAVGAVGGAIWGSVTGGWGAAAGALGGAIMMSGGVL